MITALCCSVLSERLKVSSEVAIRIDLACLNHHGKVCSFIHDCQSFVVGQLIGQVLVLVGVCAFQLFEFLLLFLLLCSLINSLLVLDQIFHFKVIIQNFLMFVAQCDDLGSVDNIFMVNGVVVGFKPILHGRNLIHVFCILVDGLDTI
jgi:hypothetical protein